MMQCPLCNTQLKTIFFSEKEQIYYKCPGCDAVVKDNKLYLPSQAEKERYQLHNNDIFDPRYREFVSPITNAIRKDFLSEDAIGLDFGAGEGSAITQVLKENNYQLNLYDPFFYPDKSVLNRTYDYIICCETMEHFHFPYKEFTLLKGLLKPYGKLYCMTHILRETISFPDWYYKNDPTHVFFYTEKTLYWIAESLGFKKVVIEDRLIVFEV